MMNLGRVLSNPAFKRDFTVLRSIGDFAVGGWQENTPKQIDMTGVVLPTTAKDILQVPEGDRVTESLTFYSILPLYVTHNDSRPGTSDRIMIDGGKYRLFAAKDYHAFGYYKVIGMRMSGD